MKLCRNINRSSGTPVSTGGTQSQKDVLRRLLKVATEAAEWTDSGRLFQTERAQDLNALTTALVLILGSNRVILLFDLSESL